MKLIMPRIFKIIQLQLTFFSHIHQTYSFQLVLTGGPCGGKTTGQSHLATFFESLGWKVFRVPETATVLMSGGISFGELNEEQVRGLVDEFMD